MPEVFTVLKGALAFLFFHSLALPSSPSLCHSLSLPISLPTSLPTSHSLFCSFYIFPSSWNCDTSQTQSVAFSPELFHLPFLPHRTSFSMLTALLNPAPSDSRQNILFLYFFSKSHHIHKILHLLCPYCRTLRKTQWRSIHHVSTMYPFWLTLEPDRTMYMARNECEDATCI